MGKIINVGINHIIEATNKFEYETNPTILPIFVNLELEEKFLKNN